MKRSETLGVPDTKTAEYLQVSHPQNNPISDNGLTNLWPAESSGQPFFRGSSMLINQWYCSLGWWSKHFQWPVLYAQPSFQSQSILQHFEPKLWILKIFLIKKQTKKKCSVVCEEWAQCKWLLILTFCCFGFIRPKKIVRPCHWDNSVSVMQVSDENEGWESKAAQPQWQTYWKSNAMCTDNHCWH